MDTKVHSFLGGAVLILFAIFSPLAAIAQGVLVRSAGELQAALQTTDGGVIRLAEGNYGELEIKRKFPALVTLQSETRHGAVFAGIRLKGVQNLELADLTSENGIFVVEGSSKISVTGARIVGTFYCRDVEGLVVRDVDISGGQYGLILNSVSQFVVAQNRIRWTTEDLMRITGRSFDGLLEYNILADTVAKRPKHPDLLQLFGTKGVSPKNITIRRNLLIDPEVKGDVIAQGIFVSDPRSSAGFQDLLIEENLISTRSPNSIYIDGGQKNVVVRRNSLIPGAGDGGAMVRLARKSAMTNEGTLVEGNTAKLLVDETKASRIGKNLFYGRKAPLRRFFSGPGERWQDFVPIADSPLDRSGMGAVAFLADLQAGRAHLGPSWVK